MTMDHWLMITAIISTLIAPIVGAFAQSRINQPRQTPVANQPPSRIQRIGGWFRRSLASPWLLVLPIFLNGWSLSEVLSSPKPLDRWRVLIIALSVSTILFMIAWMLFQFALRDYHKRHTQEFIEQAKIDLRLLDIVTDLSKNTNASDRAILDLVRTIVDAKTSSVEKTSAAANALPAEQPTQDTFDRIRTAIKRLLE